MSKFIKNEISGNRFSKQLTDYGCFLLGSAFYAFGFSFFIDPNQISPGGVTGIAAILNYLFGIPTGIMLLILNIPVLILGCKKIGKGFIAKTLVVTALTSVLIDVFALFLPSFRGDRLLAAIFGGALVGLGLALVMLRGGTTGGVDVIAKVLRLKYPFLSIGRLMLILDSVVIVLAAVCYRDIETALFAAISIFVTGKVIDTILYGADNGRLIFIITTDATKMAEAIFENVHRGVTMVSSYGGYRGDRKELLLCAVRQQEVNKAVTTIKKVDPASFTVVVLAGGIFGLGFEREER